MDKKLFAVITGDIHKSSRFVGDKRTKLLEALKKSFKNIERVLGKNIITLPFEIYRGDSFQGVIAPVEYSLPSAILIRATIRGNFKSALKDLPDARIAIGIGNINYFPDRSTGEGDGEAFRNSGPMLDIMNKRSRKIVIKSPFDEVNKELNVECALLDTVIEKWSPEQALTIIELINNKTQEEMAETFNISQPAVKKRLNSANFYAIELMMERFHNIFSNNDNKNQL